MNKKLRKYKDNDIRRFIGQQITFTYKGAYTDDDGDSFFYPQTYTGIFHGTSSSIFIDKGPHKGECVLGSFLIIKGLTLKIDETNDSEKKEENTRKKDIPKKQFFLTFSTSNISDLQCADEAFQSQLMLLLTNRPPENQN